MTSIDPAGAANPPPPPQIKLYWLEQSRSQRILWLLEELSVPYTIETFKRESMLAPRSLRDIHPLGKAPIITITPSPGAPSPDPIVLAESGAIVEYLVEAFAPHLVPAKYPAGSGPPKDGSGAGSVGYETEAWRRYKFYMHYAEGTLMGYLVLALLFNIVKSSSPFFIRPIANAIAGKIESSYLEPNLKRNFAFIESQLASAPEGGPFLCGKELTGADILMTFPLEKAAEGRVAGLTQEEFPKVFAYVDLLHEQPGYKRAVEKILEMEGVNKASL